MRNSNIVMYGIRDVVNNKLITKRVGGLWQNEGAVITELKKLYKRYNRDFVKVTFDLVERDTKEKISDIINEEKRINEVNRKVELERLEKKKQLHSELFKISGQTNIADVYALITKNILIPEYKEKIESLLKEIKKLK